MLARNTVVSTGVFALSLGVLWLLVERAGWPKLPAAALGFLIAQTIHYVLGQAWVFRGTKRGLGKGYAYFLVNGVIGLVVTLALFEAFLRFTSIHYLVARVLVSIVAGLVVFLLNAVLNFRRL